jgi:hypothetical protein
MIVVEESIKPQLKEPFPNMPDLWKCPKTGLLIPKDPVKNIQYRTDLLAKAEHDTVLQEDLLAACKQSLLFFINAFVMTYHQFDVDPKTGKRIPAVYADNPFITWEIQDDLFNVFEHCLKVAEDILVNKSRDMGASWSCIVFLHWLWLFRDNAQLLEMSRTEDYVDKAGNMKALFQKHDYINKWLPDWMLPPDIGHRQKNRSKMHLANEYNGACIDGESTTEHAGSGDRRLIALLDEFAKVENGALMRSASRDAALIRIVNSTVAGPGTEYSKWKNDGTIKVFPLMFWDHPDKGCGRYVHKHPVTGVWEIRSPWFDKECKVRSPKEIAREILANDLESGSQFFTPGISDIHKAMFGREPKTRWDIRLKKDVPDSAIPGIIKTRYIGRVEARRSKNGVLRVWTNLILGRPDQSKDYIFGIDISKGHGASNSVVSIKCKQTGEKIAEWRDANTPPYEMAKITIALAIWCGGRRGLPFLKWEKNGPGLDYGKRIVKEWHYPFYYRDKKIGNIRDKKLKKYGWQSSPDAKKELLETYDRMLATGAYINHSIWALDEIKSYVYYDDGGVGPSCLVKETQAAKKTHGDCVIADALTLDDKDIPRGKVDDSIKASERSFGHRLNEYKKKKRTKKSSWRRKYSFVK